MPPRGVAGTDLPPGFAWLGTSGQLGFTITDQNEILAAKTALLAWNASHLALASYGVADFNANWSVRDGEVLYAYSHWYNSSHPGAQPLPEADAGKNPVQTTLTDAHYKALTGLTAATPVSSGTWPTTCPAGQWYNPVTSKCELMLQLTLPPCVQDCMTKYAVGSTELAACLLKCAPSGFQPPTTPLPVDQPGAAATACLASCNAKYGFGAATPDATKLATCLTECGGQKPAGGAAPAGGGAPAGGAAAPTSNTSGMLIMGGLVIGAGLLLWLATRGGGGGAAPPQLEENPPRVKNIEGVRYYPYLVKFTLADGTRHSTTLWSPGSPWVREEVARTLIARYGESGIKPGSVTYTQKKFEFEENPRGRGHYTKRQVEEMFRADVMPVIVERYGAGDLPALREAWNNYTDSLMKDGLISRHQYETWTHPRYDENPYVSNTALYVGGGLSLIGAIALIRAL